MRLCGGRFLTATVRGPLDSSPEIVSMQLSRGAPIAIACPLPRQMVEFRCGGMQPVRFHSGQSSLEVFVGRDQGSRKARLRRCRNYAEM